MDIRHRGAQKATNLSINSDLLNKAKELHINLSATLEQAVTEIAWTLTTNTWKSTAPSTMI